MRKKMKCSECGLVQWDDGSCKRCKVAFPEEAGAPSQAVESSGTAAASSEAVLLPSVAAPPTTAAPATAPPTAAVPATAPPTAAPPNAASPMAAQPTTPDIYSEPTQPVKVPAPTDSVPVSGSHQEPYLSSIPPEILGEFERMGLWVRFVAKVGLMIACLQLLAGGFILLMTNEMFPSLSQGALLFIPVGLLYLGMGAIYWYIYLQLKKSGVATLNLRSEGSAALYRFASHMHNFWRVVGFLTLISVIVMVLILFAVFLEQIF